ncbi:MAG TPA: SbmA/BacA-like family transporter [Polyangiaceae bacterium]|nr:SbmA/BacA-like family transporter [Polyangiaceae bacterium]
MNAPDGNASEARLTRQTWHLFVTAIRNFVTSEVRGQAALLVGLLLVILFGINGLNVVNSYVGRDFMSAIERRDQPEFMRQTVRYLLVFGALTTATVLFRFLEERIGLLWRRWLTGSVVRAYLANRAYLRLAGDATLGNPDQRIAEDCRTFVTMTLSLLLMALNGTLTVIAFAGVLWSISRTLFLVGLGYAAIGSLLTVLLGRRLVDLNYQQADREADFRATLIHVRENAEPIALLHREHEIANRLLDRLAALVGNMKRIIGVNRNLGFFTTGYNYLIQIIPALIVAPLFMRRETEFGVITQSAMAFSHLLGAFSLIVTQFSAISSYASVLARLDALAHRVLLRPPDDPSLVIVEEHERLAYEKLTLRTPHEARILVRELELEVKPGSRLMIRSHDPVARRALMRATAGMWSDGVGRIVRPALAQVAFLPERPYLPPGTLRTLLRGDRETPPTDAELGAVLARLGAEAIITYAEGLDVEHSWDKVLSTRDQALLSVARLVLGRPRFAFVDNLGRTLGDEEVPAVLQLLAECGITIVVLDAVNGVVPGELALVIADDGSWHLV